VTSPAQPPAVELAGVTYRYPGGSAPALAGLDLTVAAGERLLVAGASGAGKSTLLRCLDGLVPHFHGGVLAGRLRVAGRDPVAATPRGMSDAVGLVFQDPERQFVTARVEDELAFAMENHALPRSEMGERIAGVVERLGIGHLRERRVEQLSGGERQRVAIAAVLTLRPPILALDEPTSQLDPAAAGEVLALLADLNRTLGLTLILSEHRLERVAAWAERVCHLPGDGRSAVVGAPREVLATVELAPPLVRLARTAGVAPAPLAVAEAGALAAALRQRLGGDRGRDEEGTRSGAGWSGRSGAENLHRAGVPAVPPGSFIARPVTAPAGSLDERPPATPSVVGGPPAVEARGLRFRYGGIEALRGVDLAVAAGERVVLVGANGAGKTTLLKLLVGLLRLDAGAVRVLGRDLAGRPLTEITRDVGLVPQNPARLLFSDTVADEVRFTRRAHGLPEGDPRELLGRLGLALLAGRDPRDLSGGERQRAALAAILAAGPRLLLLDEPTRGLDAAAKEALTGVLRELAASGTAVVMATHDVELAARAGERMVVLDGGRVVDDGPVGEVMVRNPRFASEVSRLLGDARMTTVEDVLERLGHA
jgi:energy-coupling factor transport system ATP-binding protein